MRPISSRIQNIYENYYAKKAKDRYQSLVQYSQYFLRHLSIAGKVHSRVDLQKMSALIDSYFLDVIRFKDYHFQPNGNLKEDIFTESWNRHVHEEKYLSPSKVASFTAKWILKYSPLIIIPKNEIEFAEEDRLVLLSATALLAFQFSLVSIGLNPEDVDEDIARNMIYHFRFRSFDNRALILQYDSLLKLAELKGVLPIKMAAESELSEEAYNKAESNGAKDKKSKVSATKKRRDDDNIYSVFIASSSDCDELRKCAIEAIDNFNEVANKTKLIAYDWTLDKQPGKQNGDFQKKIYAEAQKKWKKDSCDIFIGIFWYTFGEYTAEEYNYFIEEFNKNNEGIEPLLLCCKFEKKVEPVIAAKGGVVKLQEWIEERHGDWAEITPVRGTIKTKRDYKDRIDVCIRNYMEECS